MFSFCDADIVSWYLKSSLAENKDAWILYSQYHSCWWPGDSRSHGICSNGIDLVMCKYPYLSTTRVKGSNLVFKKASFAKSSFEKLINTSQRARLTDMYCNPLLDKVPFHISYDSVHITTMPLSEMAFIISSIRGPSYSCSAICWLIFVVYWIRTVNSYR